MPSYQAQGQGQARAKGEIVPVRVRPTDGGLDTFRTADVIDRHKSPAMRDVFMFKNELRKSPGGAQIGVDFPDPVLWVGSWERYDGITILPLTITQKHLYFYDKSIAAWTQVTPSAGTFAGDAVERWNVSPYNDTLYFVSKKNPLRSWDGNPAHTHAPVTGGFAAKGMEIINGHVVLIGTTSGGLYEAQTTRWSTTDVVPAFTGLGSGQTALVDRPDTMQNIRKLGSYRG